MRLMDNHTDVEKTSRRELLCNNETGLEVSDLKQKSEETNEQNDYIATASALLTKGKYSEAILVLESSLAEKEDKTKYHMIGWASFLDRNYPKAIHAFRNSISINPSKDWNSYNGYGWSLLRNANYFESIQAFEESLKLQRNHDTLHGLGNAYFLYAIEQGAKSNDYIKYLETSIKLLNEAILIQPEWNTYYTLGKILRYTSQYKEAIKVFEESLKLNSDFETYKQLSYLLLQINEFNEAALKCRAALSIKKDKEVLLFLGDALNKLNRFTEAISAFEESITIEECWEAYDGLGQAFLKTNKENDARNAFKKAINLTYPKSLRKDSNPMIEMLIDSYINSPASSNFDCINLLRF